uniref:Uncharacterized protein n=1 Tax=Ceratitis capitata TaxID=7213 RepID=W8ARS8_CERCA
MHLACPPVGRQHILARRLAHRVLRCHHIYHHHLACRLRIRRQVQTILLRHLALLHQITHQLVRTILLQVHSIRPQVHVTQLHRTLHHNQLVTHHRPAVIRLRHQFIHQLLITNRLVRRSRAVARICIRLAVHIRLHHRIIRPIRRVIHRLHHRTRPRVHHTRPRRLAIRRRLLHIHHRHPTIHQLRHLILQHLPIIRRHHTIRQHRRHTRKRVLNIHPHHQLIHHPRHHTMAHQVHRNIHQVRHSTRRLRPSTRQHRRFIRRAHHNIRRPINTVPLAPVTRLPVHAIRLICRSTHRVVPNIHRHRRHIPRRRVITRQPRRCIHQRRHRKDTAQLAQHIRPVVQHLKKVMINSLSKIFGQLKEFLQCHIRYLLFYNILF